MFNIILTLLCILICFALEILVYKFFKKEGLFVWIAVASVLANIMVCKQISLAGFATSLGSILFASNFLATDILSIKYGSKTSRKAVVLGLVSVIGFIIATQLGLLFIPSEIDFANDSMKALFAFGGRVSIASVTMYFLSNLADVYIFEKLRKKFPNKLWISNNLATIVCNCGENFLFGLGAFLGVFPIWTIVEMQFVGCILETIIALCDTPFLYLAKKIKHKEKLA